jgi:hypothetical protein
MVMGVGHSIAFHIDATAEDQTETAGSREGIWWLPSSTSNDYLVLANQGQNPLQLTLSLYDASGKASTQNITLPPRGMNRVSARQLVSAAKLAGSYGGIKVSAPTNAGFLDTLHVLFDQDPGFSAVMKMFFYDPRSQLSERDYAATGQWTLRAPMLALSSPDPSLAFPVGTVLQPQLFVRNTTSKPIDASLSFSWRSDTTAGKAAGPVLHLVPYETRRIDVAALQDGKTLPQNAQWTSVIITTSGLPDEVMAVAASYDQSLHYGAQTPFSDQLAVQWEGGMWQYDPQHDSIITAGNGSSKPTQVAFTIFYNQGTQKYELDQTLQPGDQIWMDIGKLIRESVPDKNGKTLPASLTSGSYDVRDLSGTRVGTLFEGKVIYDKTYGHVTYGCAACCGWGIPYPWFNPLTVPITVHVGNGMWASYPCGNYIDDVSYNFYNNWTTGNTAIATYDSTGTALGVAPGSTSSQTHGNVCSNDAHNGCPLTYRASSGTVNVGNPAQLLVIGDTTTNPTNCPNTKLRILAYQIQDSNGNNVTANVQTKEQFSSKGTNTCNTTITTSETCSGTPNGIIHDSLTVGCNSVDNGCGYTYTNQQWVWCNGTTNTVTGTVGDLVVHDNAISVGGSYTSIVNKIIKP